MSGSLHATLSELEAGLAAMAPSPGNEGVLRMIVRRPAVGEREVLAQGEVDPEVGLVGDRWRPPATAGDGEVDRRDNQVTLMNSRVIDLIARTTDRWPLAGDQFFVDLDLSAANLPPGSRLVFGGAVVEVTDLPHLGCRKFRERFGSDALAFVNSEAGRRLRLRGINARVVAGGVVRVGDRVVKMGAGANSDGCMA